MFVAFMALLSGGTIVLNRMLNAEAGTRVGVWPSTLHNYVTGLLTSLALMLMTGTFFDTLPPQWYLYTGGLIGVAVVVLSSVASPHLPAFLMTLLVFISQFLSGMLMDTLAGRSFSSVKLGGAAIVIVGLFVYILGEKSAKAE